MIKAEDTKRIALASGHFIEVVAATEQQILRCAMEGKVSTAVALPAVTAEVDRLKKTLIESGYHLDESETLNGMYKPGVLIRVTWDKS